MKKLIKRIFITAFSVLLLLTIGERRVFAIAESESGNDAATITTSKTSETVGDTKEQVNVYITQTKTAGTLAYTPTLLFLGSLCGAHGLDKDVIIKSLEAAAKFGNVQYYLFATTKSLETTSYSGTIAMNATYSQITTELKDVSLVQGSHCTTYDFANILKNATLGETSGDKKHYDYIIMEFDGFRMGYFNGATPSDTQKSNLNAAAEVLKTYYAKDKVAWIVAPDDGKSTTQNVYPYNYVNHTSTISSGKTVQKNNTTYFSNDVYTDNDSNGDRASTTNLEALRLNVREVIKLLAPEDLVNGEVPDLAYFDETTGLSDNFPTLRSRLSDYSKETGKWVRKNSGDGIWVYYNDASSVFNFLQKSIGKSIVKIHDIVAQGLEVISVEGKYKELDQNNNPTGDWQEIKTAGAFTYTKTNDVVYDTNKKGTQIDATFDMSKIYSNYSYTYGNAVKLVITCKVGDLIIKEDSDTTGKVETNGGKAVVDVVVGADETSIEKDIPEVTIDTIKVKYNFVNAPSGVESLIPATQTVKKDHDYSSVSTTGIEKTGYTFAGWYTNSACTNKYTDKTTLTANTDLYGKWSPITYKVKYNASDATSGSMSDSTHTYDNANEKLTANAYVRTGYTFAGWATSEGGTKAYDDKASITNLSSTQDEVIDLYAVWTPNTNTPYVVKHIKQDLNGDYTIVADTENLTGTTNAKVTPSVKTYEGFTSPSAQEITIDADGTTILEYKYSRNSYDLTVNTSTGIKSCTGAGNYKYEQSITLVPTTKEGYHNPTYTGDATSATFTMPANDATVNVTASPITYKVKYYGNGSTSGSMADSTHTYDNANEKLTANAYVRTGYTFAGWATSESGEKVYDDQASIINLSSTQDEVINLYAVWTPNPYKIVFNPNTPSDASSTITETMNSEDMTYDVAQNLTKNAYTLTGWTFQGWITTPVTVKASYKTKNLNDVLQDNTQIKSLQKAAFAATPNETSFADEQKVKNLTTVKNDEVKLNAVFTPNQYNVVYNANGGEGNMDNSKFTYDLDTDVVKANEFTRSGYEFTGWNTKADGTGTTVPASVAKKHNLTDEKDGYVTLYAMWKKEEKPTPSPTPIPGKDESCEKVLGPYWHWNNTKGVCEEYYTVATRTR